MVAVKKERPYWEYDAVNDRRTRPEHKALDTLVYPADHKFWDTYYPPNGFLCRCGVMTLSVRELEREGLTVRTKIPAGVKVDEGFDFNIGKQDAKIDISKYPEDWQKKYKKLVKKYKP